MGERFQWRAQGQCSKGDSCRFRHDHLFASGNSGGSQRRKGRSSSPACHSKAKQTDGEKGDTEENSCDKRSQILCRKKKNWNNPSCKFWHLPVCLNYKSEKKVMFLAINAASDVLRNTWSPTGVEKRWCERISCFLKESTQSGLCISRSLSEKVYSTWTRKIGIETRRQILQRRLALNQNSGKKGSIARHYPKVCTSWAWSLRAKIRAQITWGGLDPRTMRPQSSVGFGEKIYKLKNSDKTTFYVPGEVKGMSTPITSKRPEERDFVVDSGSINAHDEQKKNQAQKNYMDCEKVLSPNSSLDCKRWRAHSRGGTSVRSWLESVRNRATTRRNASCPVARQALQRPRILLRVGQRSSTTINPKYEKYYVQDRQFCTSFRSRVICQSRKQFVFYDAITRIVGTRGISSIFRFSIWAKWRN